MQYAEPPDRTFGTARASVATLGEALKGGRVDTLVILDGNPVFDAPAELAFADALKKIKNTIHLSLHVNETSRLCTWHVPRAHALEAWGDTRAADGTVALAQPLIEPLYGGISPAELLALVLRQPQRRGYEILHAYHQAVIRNPNFERLWREALHDGLIADSAPAGFISNPSPNAAAVASALTAASSAPASDELELVFLPHPHLYDGRYANNGWLQETNEPVSKISWG